MKAKLEIAGRGPEVFLVLKSGVTNSSVPLSPHEAEKLALELAAAAAQARRFGPGSGAVKGGGSPGNVTELRR